MIGTPRAVDNLGKGILLITQCWPLTGSRAKPREIYYTDIKPKIFVKNPKKVFSKTNKDRTVCFVAF